MNDAVKQTAQFLVDVNKLSHSDAQMVAEIAFHASDTAFTAMENVLKTLPLNLQIPALIVAVSHLGQLPDSVVSALGMDVKV